MINDLNGEDIIGACYEKELQKQIKKNLEYVKWKGYDNWIDEMDIVKWIYKKLVKTFLNHINLLEETLTLKLIYIII